MLPQGGSIHAVSRGWTPRDTGGPRGMGSPGPQCGSRSGATQPPSFLVFGPGEVVVPGPGIRGGSAWPTLYIYLKSGEVMVHGARRVHKTPPPPTMVLSFV